MVWCEPGRSVGRAVITCCVWGWEVGVVEEVSEGFGEAFCGVDTLARFGGAGGRPVQERVEGDETAD